MLSLQVYSWEHWGDAPFHSCLWMLSIEGWPAQLGITLYLPLEACNQAPCWSISHVYITDRSKQLITISPYCLYTFSAPMATSTAHFFNTTSSGYWWWKWQNTLTTEQIGSPRSSIGNTPSPVVCACQPNIRLNCSLRTPISCPVLSTSLGSSENDRNVEYLSPTGIASGRFCRRLCKCSRKWGNSVGRIVSAVRSGMGICAGWVDEGYFQMELSTWNCTSFLSHNKYYTAILTAPALLGFFTIVHSPDLCPTF